MWRNPANPLQVQPPKTTPFSRLPPKLPPVPKTPLGPLAKLKPTIPGLLFFAALLLLDWWLDQPPPPPSSPPSSNPGTGTYTDLFDPINPPSFPAGVYEIFDVVATYRKDFFSGSSPANVLYTNRDRTLVQGPIFSVRGRWGTFGQNSVNFATVQRPNISESITLLPEGDHGYGPGNHTLVSFSYGIRLISGGPPAPPPPTLPPPPYSLRPPGADRPLAPPTTSPTTPNNPAPGEKPKLTPPFSPFSPSRAPNLPQTTPDDERRSPFLPPLPDFSPPNLPQLFPPATDPFFDRNRQPQPPSGRNPVAPPRTTPENPRDPNRDREPFPFFPPFPIINPRDPQTDRPNNPSPPVNQSPPGNNCCVPTPIDTKLDRIKDRLDLVTPILQVGDLALLRVIDNKLGPQINGGLSGYLQDRFTKLWKSRVIDRALNLMAMAASIHNAVMLSRNIGSTLISTLGNTLSIIGIKDGDEVAQNFSTVIGDQIENIVKGLIGNENYTQLSQTWAKANRIYQSAINIYQLMTDSLFGITQGLEQTAKYTGKIGNALRKSGVVLENSYNWMSETFNFSSGKNRKIDRVIQGLQDANEIASDLESITSEFRSVTENITAIGTEVNTIKTEINGKEEDKRNNETNSKNSSQSPQINKPDLIRPDN